ncbi:Ig-like domain repeat protein [Aeromicrobium sp. CFBP 8757]|uniref:Ig-like domain repeat protein n=1 Tax=Aeromicrobium sp. CFBP 8757 TaxID=2775288 RepID=UPI001785E48B|nr:Ig-like domain repeat protein [Aeromicrobium sp. CFBP 8757]MBD8608757.1 Ig-like domain repeat protein [Aeromicrobium sp. CFBP 8757]
MDSQITRRRRATGVTFAAAVSVVVGLLGAAPASAVEAVGPTVTYTGDGPTGYSATFRYDAPDDVTSVQVYGEWLFSKPSSIVSQTTADLRTGKDWQPGDVLAGYSNAWRTIEMTKDTDGIWTYTTPLPSGTFSYSFTHGCTTPNASGCTKYPDPENLPLSADLPGATQQTLSQVYVPQSSKFPTYDNDYQAPTSPARTGMLVNSSYASPLPTDAAATRRVTVYLPAGYDKNRAAAYPTLYLSHGGGGNETDWATQGVAQYILENAVKDGEAQPAVLVMTNFNGLSGNQAYANDLRNNVIPFVEAGYNVSKKSDDRAFAGLSAGGARGLTLLYDNTDLFGYYGLWSSAAAYTAPTAEQLQRMKSVKGSIHSGAGKQDFLIDINASSIARANGLRALGVDVTSFDVDGIHSWDVWRQLLDNFVRTSAFKTTDTSIVPAAVATPGRLTSLVASVSAVTTTGATPTGRVAFYAGGTAESNRLGSAALGVDGRATLSTTFASAGSVPVVAVYEGDDLFEGSTAPQVTQVVSAGLGSASVSFKISPSSVKVGRNAKATVVVSARGGGSPTGTFAIKKGSKTLKTVTLRAGDKGRRTVTVPKLPKGKHTLVVVYSGNDTLKGKTSTKRVLRVR